MRIPQNIVYLAAHPVEFLKFMRSDVWQLILDGGISIETLFEYQPTRKGDAYRFRTTVQLDADIINFVPEPDLYPGNLDWQKAFQKGYQAHQETLKRFAAQLDGVRIFAWIIGAMISTLVIVSMWKRVPLEIRGYPLDWVYLIVWSGFVYAVRRYALTVVFRLIVWLVTWWIQMRWRLT